MHAVNKKCIRKIAGRVKWSPKYKEAMDLVELWVLLITYMAKIVANVDVLTSYNFNSHS